MINPAVQIRRIESYDLPAVEEAVRSFFKYAKSGKLNRCKRVLIKPNALGAYPPERAVTTHPIVLEAIIRYLLDKKKEVWIGDSPGGTVNVDKVWQTCGFADLAERYPIKVVNLSTEGFRELKYNGIPVKISEVFWQCSTIINVAKYKTHSLTAFTGALKNLYGLVPGMVKTEYHRQYPDTKSFSELLLALYALTKSRISYSFIDGIIGMDGAGPAAGTPRPFGLFLGSTSIPALDFTAARMMGFNLKDVPYMSAALQQDGILPSRIIVPTSFKHYRIPKVEISVVKRSKDSLRYVPAIAKHAFSALFSFHPEVSIRCKNCGVCVKSCPVGAISWETPNKPFVLKNKCIKCMCCHELCPYQAIDIHKSFVARMVMP
ncbi:MAG: iron-sulfur cluster-binding protein [Candidatus Cloacimonetes bacterium HGW-Cloacimonetes-3]|jgi:uncharacterized protein (DUF362 family)/NAD-dependent dihydropyrimidine dehydrogenase PreA subunit|nr:MAG: iron-sulfur cluster-binding protein [Candidatus Cloacimonetes bacterium HGW-Cloacimonetes-3]